MPLGSIFDPGRSLGLHWCIFETSWGVPGDPWELQGWMFIDFGNHFGGPWEVSFHVFSL